MSAPLTLLRTDKPAAGADIGERWNIRAEGTGCAPPVHRARILMLLQLPPPLHGASVVNKQVVESKLLHDNFTLDVVPISMSDDISDIRGFGFAKVVRSVNCFYQVAARLFGQRKPSLVYFTLSPNGWAFYRDLIFVAMFRLSGARHVYHLHGRGVTAAMQAAPWKNRLYRFAFARAKVVSLALSLAKDVGALVPASRLFVVPNGVRDTAPRTNGASPPRAPNEPPKILFVSNMQEQKGPLVLLEALALLARKGMAFEAQFAGAWRGAITSEMFMAKVREFGLQQQVSHLGVITGEEKTGAFSRADIFAFPTYYDHEAFPLVVIEAMMHGLAVVTTTVGALPEIITSGRNGELVEPENVTQLAMALERLVQRPALRERYGRMARDKYETELTDAHFEQKLAETLSLLVSES